MLVFREVKRISINTVEGSAYLGTRFSYITAHVQKYLCSTKLRPQTFFLSEPSTLQKNAGVVGQSVLWANVFVERNC